MDRLDELDLMETALEAELVVVDLTRENFALIDEAKVLRDELAEWRERGVMLPHWINRDEFADDLEAAQNQRHPTWFKQVALATRKASGGNKPEEGGPA